MASAIDCRLIFGMWVGLTVLPDAAMAQVRSPVDRPLNEVGQKLRAKGAQAPPAAGYTIAPGLIVTPTGHAASGYDSNPNELPQEDGSLFSRMGAGLSVTSIGPQTIANLSAAGTWLHLDDIERGDRYLATVTADVAHALAPGITLSAGGLYEYDGFDFVEDHVAGAYAELGYERNGVTAFGRVRTSALQFLSDIDPPAGAPVNLLPFFELTAFDMRRHEVSGGVMLFSQSWIAPYVEAAGALVDYTDQPDTLVINRDADDYYAKAGIRVTFSPVLRSDIGWRWNLREFSNDPLFDDFSSDYFDASLTWTPSQYFSLVGTIDRTVNEPLGAFGRLADVKSFRAAMTYRPFDRVALTLSGKRETLEDIGSNLFFRVHEIETEASYQAASWAQLYAGLYYEHIEEDRSDDSFDRFRIGGGLRVALGETSGGASDPFVLPFTQPAQWHGPDGSTLTFEVGPSWFDLPETRMTTIVGGTFFDEAIGKITDHDGFLPGVRADIRLDDAAHHYHPSGRSLAFSFDGFFGYYEDEGRSRCSFTAQTDCALVNIDDFDADNENNTGAFGQIETTTDRQVYYWGAAASARLSWMQQGGLKDEAVSYDTPFRIGADFRGLHERTHLHMIDVSVPDPVDYNEDLDTFYYGGFVGYAKSFPLREGLTLTLDGQAGLYYAHTAYEGRYIGYIPVGGSVYVLETGAIDDGHEDVSVIAEAQIRLDHQFSWGRLGVYGRGEYLSYVPRVQLNNNDEAGGSPFGIVGTDVGTKIVSDDAWNYSIGLSVTIPISSP